MLDGKMSKVKQQNWFGGSGLLWLFPKLWAPLT